MPVVTLREITRDNVKAVCKLALKPEQQGFVAPNGQSIAEGCFSDEAWMRAIYADENPVGFAMLYVEPEKAIYYLWRFMIAAAHQGRGYGKQAIELLIDHIRTLPNASVFLTSYQKGPGGPEGFYLKLGFQPTGEIENDQHTAKLDLSGDSSK